MWGNKLKVVVVANSGDSLVRFRGPLLSLMKTSGHQVATISPNYTANQIQELSKIGVNYHTFRLNRVSQNPLSDLRALIDLVRWFRRERPDASLTYFIKPNIYGGLAAAFVGTARRVAMIEGLGYLFTDNDDRKKLHKKIGRWFAVNLLRISLRSSHRVIFLNPDDQMEFVRRGIVQPDQTMILGGIGVDLKEYDVVPLPAGAPSFLFIGRLLREKGFIEYITAAKILKAQYPEARFRFAGGIDMNPGGLSHDEILQLSADGNVEWLGEVADVRPAIAESSVFVLPSYREGVPRSTQEAMAMGRPVITTDTPGCRETLVSGVNGFFAEARDVASLVEAMRRFCDNPEIISKMGMESRRIAEQRFDIQKANEAIYATLQLSQ